MIDGPFLVEELLNGVQLGLMLFLMAAGLTLTFGIMNLVNLAHGSFYMVASYLAAMIAGLTGSFLLAAGLALIGTLLLGAAVEVASLRPLYRRGHLDQVLATFGLTLFFNEMSRILWGSEPYPMSTPSWLSGEVQFSSEIYYPAYRLAISVVALAAGGALALFIRYTKLGSLVRAGANNREMLQALGINIRLIYTFVFGLGAALAGLAGIMTAPVLTVQIGVGDPILIVVLVIIVIGGIGSIVGAFFASLLVGVVDTFARLILPMLFGNEMGAPLASMALYVLLALILIVRPRGFLVDS